jgi:poly(A) polymerase
MPEPVVVPRSDHPISRRDIDPDALKVLYRLREFNYASYLVGGSVRDLLLQRRPKDFDVGTDAHPYEIRRLFRNCWIIGRRFRLAHVRFGPKVIEVATFRRHVPPETDNEPPPDPGDVTKNAGIASHDRQIRHDNTFGTPEEDAFRRDFTINALFYDIATFSIIDYVGGLTDLRQGLIRSIGDPEQRFQEDPVRMFRAVALAARLGFALDPPVVEAIGHHRRLLGHASPARLIEEYYKVLRSGAAASTFRMLADYGLLEMMTPELCDGGSARPLGDALAALDRYRGRFASAPATLTNSILLGTMLVPLGLMPRRTDWVDAVVSADVDDDNVGNRDAGHAREHAPPFDGRPGRAGREPLPHHPRGRRPPKEPALRIGILPIARRDTERLRQTLSLQRRLIEERSSSHAHRSLVHRSGFDEALAWLEIHGRAPEAVVEWRAIMATQQDHAAPDGTARADVRPRRGRRRRGRRGRGS